MSLSYSGRHTGSAVKLRVRDEARAGYEAHDRVVRVSVSLRLLQSLLAGHTASSTMLPNLLSLVGMR